MVESTNCKVVPVAGGSDQIWNYAVEDEYRRTQSEGVEDGYSDDNVAQGQSWKGGCDRREGWRGRIGSVPDMEKFPELTINSECMHRNLLPCVYLYLV